MQRKKPQGNDLIQWCGRWDLSNHAAKLKLCEESEITYDTGKHWRSESGNISKAVVPKSEEHRMEDESIESLNQLLAIQPRAQLDFVCFDLETSGFKADFSIVLCATVKPFGRKPLTFRADDYPEWTTRRKDDSKIVTDVANELGRHAIVITHYGSKFDIPYLRAKLVKYGLPNLPPMFGIDTYAIAKANFQISSRRLVNLARYFELQEKHQVEGELWMEATLNGARMDEIVKHNRIDCKILESLAAISFPYLRSIRKL